MREELLTRMIQMYGFEHEVVIQFAELMEQGFETEVLQTIVETHERAGFAFEEEED